MEGEEKTMPAVMIQTQALALRDTWTIPVNLALLLPHHNMTITVTCLVSQNTPLHTQQLGNPGL